MVLFKAVSVAGMVEFKAEAVPLYFGHGAAKAVAAVATVMKRVVNCISLAGGLSGV
jgi:hypothetical protein